MTKAINLDVAPNRTARTLPRGTFSCNKHGDVWRPPGFGFTPTAERTNLKGTDLRLDAVVGQVLRDRPAGARFVVTNEGVFLADGRCKVIDDITEI